MCESESETSLSIHQFFDFLTLSKASRSLHRNLHCIFIQLYLYSVLSSLYYLEAEALTDAHAVID